MLKSILNNHKTYFKMISEVILLFVQVLLMSFMF